MSNVTDGCHGLHGGVEDVNQRVSDVEGMLSNVGVTDSDARRNILKELKIITRAVTGYLDESIFPRVDDPEFTGRASGILNGVRDMVFDNVVQ